LEGTREVESAVYFEDRQCPKGVKLRRTQNEQMSSGLALKADIARYSRHVSKVPASDIAGLA